MNPEILAGIAHMLGGEPVADRKLLGDSCVMMASPPLFTAVPAMMPYD